MRGIACAVVLTGCISIPEFHGNDDASNGSADAPIGPLAARFIANAYREGGNDGVANGTLMMSKMGFGIMSAGVNEGDLVVFIANVDNGAQGFWHLPAGFNQGVQNVYGQDGQDYVIAWKIATAAEPSYYVGTYTSAAQTSAAATITLISVTGYNPQLPISVWLPTDHYAPTDPADTSSAGITTTADNSMLIFAAGADWTPNGGSNTYVLPADFQLLTSVGDRNTHWDWTSQVVAYKVQPVAGPTGALTSSLTGRSFPDGATPIPGGGWNVVFAINPRS